MSLIYLLTMLFLPLPILFGFFFGHSLISKFDPAGTFARKKNPKTKPGGSYFHLAAECDHEWEDGKRRSLQ